MTFWKITFVTHKHGVLVVPVATNGGDTELLAIERAVKLIPFTDYDEVRSEAIPSDTADQLDYIEELNERAHEKCSEHGGDVSDEDYEKGYKVYNRTLGALDIKYAIWENKDT